MKFGKSKSKGKSSGGFVYQPRDTEKIQQRATRRISGGESYFSEHVKFFTPREGDHEIRILPPTWPDAEHFGIDVWLHYGIGPDGGSYLCPQKMNGEPCPMCEERARAQKEGEDDLANALASRPRVAFYLIDRRDARSGPKVWSSPPRTEKEICAQAHDKKTRSFVNLDDPSEDGYDVSFTVEGTGMHTRYTSIKVDRSPSPLSDDSDLADQWLEQINEHPLSDCLVFFDYDHLKNVLEGGVRVDPKGDKKEERDTKPRGKGKEEDAAPPRRGKPSFKDDADPDPDDQAKAEEEFDLENLTWAAVHELDEDDTERLVAQAELDEKDFEDCDDLEEVHDIICQRLGVSEKPKVKASGKGGVASRLAELRSKRK